MDNSTEACQLEAQWHLFFSSSFVVFLGGLVLLVIGHVLIWFCSRCCHKGLLLTTPTSFYDFTRGEKSTLPPKKKSKILQSAKLNAIKDWAGGLISGQTRIGKCLVGTAFFLSIVSVGVYIYEASVYPFRMENCTAWLKSPLQSLDVAINLFFLLYFCIQFLAAPNKLWFWLEIYSIVEYFTVPPSILSIFLNRSWLGLRCLRVLRIMTLTDVLQYLSILQSGSTIRLWQLSTLFLSIWMTGAGVFQLLENSVASSQSDVLTYGEALYFTVVTMSTVGYGDMSPKSTLGRIFVSIFILFALGIFATTLPEIVAMFFYSSRYAGHYRKEYGKRHVIVCGDIHKDSVESFLADFLHEDREENNVEVIFINAREPDLPLQATMKRHFTKVKYFLGTVMDPIDLQRVKVSQADACLVLANKRCEDPDTEDAANILRVISIKNFDPTVRVIIQLLQHHNKPYLLNIPCWDWRAGDEVVCLSELKMGFLAQSCLAPGFSTLLANLFSMRSSINEDDSKKYMKQIGSNEWLADYLRGVSQEIYSEYFSSTFVGMTFKEAAAICFEKINLLLVALESEIESEEKFLAINPDSSVKIQSWTQGFFICESQDDAKRAFYFCRACHWDITDISEIKRCRCHPNAKREIKEGRPSQSSNSKIEVSSNEMALIENQGGNNLPLIEHHSNSVLDDKGIELETGMSSAEDESDFEFDITGTFYWVQARDFDTVVHKRYNYQAFHGLKDHVVVCVFADKDSPRIGLLSFVLPMRANNLDRDSLKHIIFIGNEEFLQREWMDICNFPNISLIAGSPMTRSFLRMARINTCSMCVVLSAKQNFTSPDDIYLIDKEVILCSLNIKSMPFAGRPVRFLSSTPSPALSRKGLQPLIPSGKSNDLIITNNPLDTPKLSGIGKQKKSVDRQSSRLTNNITVLTELIVDGNVQFLDQNDDDLPEAEVYVTQPYACGSAFTSSVLDSLMSTAYFNKNALTFIRTLITGGATPELEDILAEGIGLKGCPLTLEVENNRQRCRIGQLSLTGPELGDLWRDKYKISSAIYKDLFNLALESRGILCIALYRLKDHVTGSSDSLRCVITNPPSGFHVYPSDLVFAIIPYDSKYITA